MLPERTLFNNHIYKSNPWKYPESSNNPHKKCPDMIRTPSHEHSEMCIRIAAIFLTGQYKINLESH